MKNFYLQLYWVSDIYQKYISIPNDSAECFLLFFFVRRKRSERGCREAHGAHISFFALSFLFWGERRLFFLPELRVPGDSRGSRRKGRVGYAGSIQAREEGKGFVRCTCEVPDRHAGAREQRKKSQINDLVASVARLYFITRLIQPRNSSLFMFLQKIQLICAADFYSLRIVHHKGYEYRISSKNAYTFHRVCSMSKSAQYHI